MANLVRGAKRAKAGYDRSLFVCSASTVCRLCLDNVWLPAAVADSVNPGDVPGFALDVFTVIDQ